MAVVKNLMVRSGADFSALYKETKKASKQLSDFKTSVSSTMKGVAAALAAVGIGTIIKDSVKSAMDVEASVQQIGRIMGQSSTEFLKWANTQALAFNMSKAEALKYGAVYGNLISGFAKDTGETLKYTQDLLKASAAVASGTGRTMEDVMERIRSGMLGNTESIEDLGINVNIAMIESTDAFKKFANGKSWNQLSFQTQQQIRLFAILEQSVNKYGASVSENTSSRQAQFVAQLKNIQLSLGQAFLPIYNAVLPALTSLASSLASVMGVIAQFSQALFGSSTKQQAQTTTKQAGAVNGLGDAYKKAGKEAKKAQGALAGFDEINNISDNSKAGAGDESEGVGALATGTGEVSNFGGAIDGISPKIQEMASKVREAFQGISSFISENKDYIISAIAGILTAFAGIAIFSNWATIVAEFNTALAALSGILTTLFSPVALVGAAIAIIAANIVYLWRTNEDFRSSVIEIWNQIKEFFVKVVSDMWQSAKDVWERYGGTLINNLKGFMKSIQDIILALWDKFIKPIMKSGLEALTTLWNEHLSGLVKQIMEFVMKLANAALEIWNQFISPIIVWLIEKLGPIFATVFGAVAKSISSILGVAADVAKGLVKSLGGIVDFISGTLTGNWEKAWNGIKDIFKGIFDSLVAIVKTPLNFIIDMVNKVVEGVNSMIKGLNKVPGVNITATIPKIHKLAKGGITNGPMLAMIGDNPGGKEVVSPLDDLKDMISSAVGTAVMSAMQFSSGSDKKGDIVLQIDGTTIARVLNPYSSKEAVRIGGAMIKTV